MGNVQALGWDAECPLKDISGKYTVWFSNASVCMGIGICYITGALSTAVCDLGPVFYPL